MGATNKPHIIKAKKSAINFNRPNVSIRSASGPMYAEIAEDLCPSVDVAYVNLKPILNYNEFKVGLRDHPDSNYVNYILNGIQHGVNIGYNSDILPIGSKLN